MKFKNKNYYFSASLYLYVFLATLVLFSMQHIQMRAIEPDLWCRRGRIQLFFQFCPASEPVYKRNLSGSIQGGRQPAGETGGWSIP